jgi:hypothetical protein
LEKGIGSIHKLAKTADPRGKRERRAEGGAVRRLIEAEKEQRSANCVATWQAGGKEDTGEG